MMIGVVVWSNRARQQAVIWCEDHAALAYLAGDEHCAACVEWPQPGDMLELESEMVGDLRCARSVRPLVDERLSLLPEMLRRNAEQPPSPRRHLTLVSSGPGRPADADYVPTKRGIGAA